MFDLSPMGRSLIHLARSLIGQPRNFFHPDDLGIYNIAGY